MCVQDLCTVYYSFYNPSRKTAKLTFTVKSDNSINPIKVLDGMPLTIETPYTDIYTRVLSYNIYTDRDLNIQIDSKLTPLGVLIRLNYNSAGDMLTLFHDY